MVYGFVKQSGGHVKIYSEIGEGTTIRLYLPRAMESEDQEVVVDAGPITGGTETVLVVEDDGEVRATVVEMLSDLGYRVLKAVDAQSAAERRRKPRADRHAVHRRRDARHVEEPRTGRKARERLPDIAVLFTSGYTENSIVHGGKLDAGRELLSKPYTREALARKFRQVLAINRQRRAMAEGPAAPTPTGPTVLLVEGRCADPGEYRRGVAGRRLRGRRGGERGRGDGRAADRADRRAGHRHQSAGGIGVRAGGRARALRPGVGLVFASGDIAAVADDDLAGAVLLSKP